MKNLRKNSRVLSLYLLCCTLAFARRNQFEEPKYELTFLPMVHTTISHRDSTEFEKGYTTLDQSIITTSMYSAMVPMLLNKKFDYITVEQFPQKVNLKTAGLKNFTVIREEIHSQSDAVIPTSSYLKSIDVNASMVLIVHDIVTSVEKPFDNYAEKALSGFVAGKPGVVQISFSYVLWSVDQERAMGSGIANGTDQYLMNHDANDWNDAAKTAFRDLINSEYLLRN